MNKEEEARKKQLEIEDYAKISEAIYYASYKPTEPPTAIGERNAKTGLHKTLYPNGGDVIDSKKIDNTSYPKGTFIRETGQGIAYKKRREETQTTTTSTTQEFYPVKILFSIKNGSNYDFYIGGDRYIPELIFTLEYNAELDWNPFEDLYYADLTNTGNNINDWIVTYSYFDLESPYSDEFVPVEWGYYYQTIKIVKKVDGEIITITHQVPYDDPLKLLKYGCASTNFYQGADYFSEFATAKLLSLNPTEENTLIDIIYDNDDYIYPDPNSLDGYVPKRAYEWYQDGRNEEEIMLVGSGETDESLITFNTIYSAVDELGGIFNNSNIEDRTDWHKVNIRFNYNSATHIWDWDTTTENDQDGIISYTYAGLGGLYYRNNGFNNKFDSNCSLIFGDYSNGYEFNLRIKTVSDAVFTFQGGSYQNFELDYANGYRAFHFIDNENSVINEITAEKAAINGYSRLKGYSNLDYKGYIVSNIDGQISEYNGSFTVLGINFEFTARSANFTKADTYNNGSTFVFELARKSNLNYVTEGYNIGLVGNISSATNSNNCLFESFITTFTNNTDRNNPLTTFESIQYLFLNKEKIEIDKNSLQELNWLDNNGRWANVFWLDNLVNNKYYQCSTYNWWNVGDSYTLADVFNTTITNYLVDEYEIGIDKTLNTYGQMYFKKYTQVTLLSCRIEEENIGSALWWAASYYPLPEATTTNRRIIYKK